MQRILLSTLAAALAATLLAACSTPQGPQQPVVLNKKQLESLAARAKSPQLFGITMYPSDAGPVFAGAFRVHDGDVAAITFPRGETTFAPIVQVGSGGETRFNALLDTASPQSWATLAMMDELQIKLLAAPSLLASRPLHVFDTLGGILGVAGHLKIDQLNMENVLLQVRAASGALGPVARGLELPNLEVVLGADALKAFNHVQFNFPARFVTLSASQDYRPNETNLLATVPLLITNGAIAAAALIDGESSPVILDTGGDYAFALPTNRPAVRVRQLSLGDLVMRDLPGVPGMDLALGPIALPRVGRQALARFKVTIDFRNRSICFERP